MIRRFGIGWVALCMVCLALSSQAAEQHKQAVTGYVVPAAAVTGAVPETTVIHLAIGLQPRDAAGLHAFAQAVSDPKSSQFRHFLTLEELTERYSPTAADYQAVIDWAQANGLTVEAQYPHRLLLAVKGRAADVERALAVKLGYAKRADGTTFYRPDRAPSIELDVKIAQIAGVDNLFVPRHHGGSFFGGAAYGSSDLRNAYAGSCLGLTGAGESVGIMSYAYYAPTDITSYETAVGMASDSTNTSACGASTATSAPCLINDTIPSSFQPQPGASASGTAETTADVELAIAMAPGLKQVEVFQGDPSEGCTAGDNILAAWLATPSIMQFSSSTDYCLEGNDISVIDMMAGHGQSFFASSGDDGTGYTPQVINGQTEDIPNFNTYLNAEITPVGGTVLTMNGTGKSYNSEQAWDYSGGGVENDPSLVSSCAVGCIPGVTAGCSQNCIPPYQVGVANAQNGASATYRNDPDMALPSQGLYVVQGGLNGIFCGTSGSSPLMAGFMALVNQQLCADSPSGCTQGVGFVSPSLYAIGMNASTYATSFNDVIGDATTAVSCGSAPSTAAPAVTGYDLATGWGSPTCGLVSQLTCTTCSGTTASPGTIPSTSCVSFQSDPNNCGKCGNVCSSGSTCSKGQCQTGSSDGDTHMTTFDGLYYDFQASGEFILARDSDFEVQAREESGAPRWPDATVNKSVATRMGRTSVTLCVEPERFLLDGKPADLADGKTLSLPDGVSVSRNGDEYVIRRHDGETVQTTLNQTPQESWIDVSIGLGNSSHGQVSGLLGNGNGSTEDDIWPRGDAKALAQPVSFDDLYRRYGASWQVEPDQSLLCGDGKIEYGIPAKPFYASDLDPRQYRLARDLCTAAGVKGDELLDACTLDATVLNGKPAVRVFTLTPRPVATMRPILRPVP